MRRIAISDRRMGHGRRKTKRYWKSAREELKGGRRVACSLGAEEDRCRVAAAVATFEAESRRAADHLQAYPGPLEQGCEVEELKTLLGGMREQNCWQKGKEAEDPKAHDLRAHQLTDFLIRVCMQSTKFK